MSCTQLADKSRRSCTFGSYQHLGLQRVNFFFLGKDDTSAGVSDAVDIRNVIRKFQQDIVSGTNNLGLCVVIEDIDPVLAGTLADVTGTPISFFDRHLVSSPFGGDIGDNLFTDLTSPLPSQVCSDSAANIHFQRTVSLGTSRNHLDSHSYKLRTEDNSRRPVRPVLESPEGVFAFVASCFSISRTKLDNDCWICELPRVLFRRRSLATDTHFVGLMLVDAITADIVSVRQGVCSATTSIAQLRTTQVSYRRLLPESSPSFGHRNLPWTPQAPLGDPSSTISQGLCEALASIQPGSYSAETSFIQLARPMIDVIIGEWMCYALCMARSVKVHEPISTGSGNDIICKATERSMVELFRWRRRSQRSLAKLRSLICLIEHPPNRVAESDILTRDIQFIVTQIEQYRDLLEAMVPMLTSILQIADSRRAIREAIYVKNLTYVALIFLPLGFVSSLLSIDGDFAMNKERCWVYFVVSLPLLALVLALSHYAPSGALVLKRVLSDRRLSKGKDLRFDSLIDQESRSPMDGGSGHPQ